MNWVKFEILATKFESKLRKQMLLERDVYLNSKSESQSLYMDLETLGLNKASLCLHHELVLGVKSPDT